MTRSARFWPIAIVVLLAANAAGTAILIRASGGDDVHAVEPDYYRKAVAWDSIAAARHRAAELGWRLPATLGPIGDDGGAELQVTLLDRAGAPMSNASLRVVAIHNAHAHHAVEAELSATAPGQFAARLPLRWAGRWEMRFTIERAGERVPVSTRLEAARP